MEDSHLEVSMKRSLSLFVIIFVAATMGAFAQSGGERTVEESYLQESLETMIIREQAYADSKDMKLVALQYIRQAIDEGRMNQDIARALEFLATETTSTIIRAGGVGRVINNYPDVRREAALLLGEFKTVEAKDALLKVALSDNEPMVIAAAMRSLGKVGMNDNDDVTQAIAFIVNRFDILMPDNSLAFESLVALELLANAQGGLKDTAAIRAIMRIADGSYITPVRQKARNLLNDLRTASNSSGK
jgi:HEAT repeat protein